MTGLAELENVPASGYLLTHLIGRSQWQRRLNAETADENHFPPGLSS